jgi:Cu-Zn family superoxide dismutase
MLSRTLASTVLIALALAGAEAAAQPTDSALVILRNAEGDVVGNARLVGTPNGTIIHVGISGLLQGVHGFHVHETGTCEPPFESAGGHFNPDDRQHGFLSEDGPHAGDMPNIHVPATGTLALEIFNARLVLDDKLFDEDGAALVVHEQRDDYETDPAGAAGARIACGVIER